jgi:NitT/TauT family transport system permease protein
MPSRRATVLKCGAFLLPLALWSLVSYVPFIYHPEVVITDEGDFNFKIGSRVSLDDFEVITEKLAALGKTPPSGDRANPLFLQAPHEVAVAFYSALTSPPDYKDTPWLYQNLWHSGQIIFWGFVLSALIGLPLGILCGTFDLFSKLTEPFIDFIRYMPAPAFGAMCVAVWGLHDGPKVAIIWIGTFFQMVLVVANTTRQFDPALLEAAQTLGATRRSLLWKVILPGILPNLYNDMRILIGWAWTYLIVAELIGAKSGISEFIYHNQIHFHYDYMYAGIIMIGLVGLAFDQLLAFLAPFLFPWQPNSKGRVLRRCFAFVASLARPKPVAAPVAETGTAS